MAEDVASSGSGGRAPPAYPYAYDPALRAKAKAYTRGRLLQAVITGEALPIVLHAVILLSGLSFAVAPLIRSVFGQPDLGNFAFILFYAVFLSGIALPVSFFTGYVYEHRYGLSRQTVGGWYRDWLKGLVLAMLIGGLLGSGLYFVMRVTPLWWLVGAVAYFLLTAVLIRLAPTLFIKIFFKMEPYRDEGMKSRLLAMCGRAGAPEIKNVYLLRASEKTKKANAAFTGYGGSKCVILFDTLTDEFHPDEVEGVVAHELGHYVNKDVARGLALQGALAIPVFYAVSLVLSFAASSFGTSVADIALFPVLYLAIDGLMFVLTPGIMAISRWQERRADEFALKWASRPEALASAFRRLADQGLGDDDPPRAAVLFMMSHPPIKERVEMVVRMTTNGAHQRRSPEFS
ncbi:MAG TPA: M48 family metalloprotease [Thermoplasmata archaeon]|nr:M48 family metalloprotease [Thermoplasmata archaeon]